MKKQIAILLLTVLWLSTTAESCDRAKPVLDAPPLPQVQQAKQDEPVTAPEPVSVLLGAIGAVAMILKKRKDRSDNKERGNK